jgi:hypothetical protein
MRFEDDDRGVSEVVGAILVFGLMVALLAVMQTQAVPAANEEVEYNHNQDVQSDLVKFQETASRVAASGTSESSGIRMGTTYPSRMLFFNPRSPGGELRTTGSGSIAIENVEATDPIVNKHFGGSLTGLETTRVEYRPSYNEYRNAPTTTLEYGAVYRDFGEKKIIDNPGQIISGNTISLTLFAGDLSRTSGRAMSLEAQPTSAPTRTVSVQPTANVMTIRLPTKLDASEWEKIVGDEENVEEIRNVTGEDAVEIDLDGDKTYNLRMSKIGIGSGVESPDAAYVAPVRTQNIQTQQANRLPIEIRDKYNNPVSGESVNISVDTGQFQNGQQFIESRSVEDGQPAAQYFAGQTGTVTIEASYARKPSSSDFNPADNPEDIQFQITFNPQLDDIDPTIHDYDVSLQTYTVCGSAGAVNQLNCAAAGSQEIEMHQVRAEYDLSDTGGAGLDHMNVKIYEDSKLLTESSQSIAGAQTEGRFVSPLFPETEGEPNRVEIVVYDKNGNSDDNGQPVAS